jgi:hypothetical protein
MDDDKDKLKEEKEKMIKKVREEMENEAALIIALEIKKKAAEEVEAYLASEDFRTMVDNMKRRERERIMREVFIGTHMYKCIKMYISMKEDI